jgi:hypothetical protein
MGDRIDPRKSKKDSVGFDVGSLVRFVGYDYTPEFIMIDDHHNEIGVVVGCLKDGLREHYDMYTVYWFKCGKTTKASPAHLKLLSL